jgi:hypothetical protein
MQGNCSDTPPAVPNSQHHFTPLAPPTGICQILINSGFLNWTSGDDGTARLPSQPDVWLHGLHIVNLQLVPKTAEGSQAYSLVYFAPPRASRLWLTHMHFQSMHTGVMVGKRSDAFIAGAAKRIAQHVCWPKC